MARGRAKPGAICGGVDLRGSGVGLRTGAEGFAEGEADEASVKVVPHIRELAVGPLRVPDAEDVVGVGIHHDGAGAGAVVDGVEDGEGAAARGGGERGAGGSAKAAGQRRWGEGERRGSLTRRSG